MDLSKITNILDEFVSSKQMKLFEVTYHKSDSTLSVLLDEKLSMDELEAISSQISQLLDQYEDEFEDNYFLDVSTVGAERPIRNEEELCAAIGEYIYVKTKENEYYGTLKAYDEGNLRLIVKDKTREKEITVPYNKCRKLRYAVKF